MNTSPLVSGYVQSSAQFMGNVQAMPIYVRVKAGWLGQVILYPDGDVLWESKPKKTAEKANVAAQKALKQGVKDLFNYLPGQV